MIRGAMALLSGLRLLLARAQLRAILWRMLALMLVLMVVIFGATFWLMDYIAALWIPGGDAWYWQLLSWLAGMLAFVLAMICGIVSFVMLASAASAPWLDELAARTEALSGNTVTEQQTGWVKLVAGSLSNSLRPLFGLLLWGVAALVFFWLPPLATALWAYGSIRFLSYELIDTPASRRGWDFNARKQALNDHRWFYIGFGGVGMLLMLVPVLNLLMLPAAVVGLSKELFRLQNSD